MIRANWLFRTMFILGCGAAAPNMLEAQVGSVYNTVSYSSDGRTIYATTVMNVTMTNANATANHRYATSVGIKDPAGHLVNSSNSASHPANQPFTLQSSTSVYDTLSGVYDLEVADTAFCSFANLLFLNVNNEQRIIEPPFINAGGVVDNSSGSNSFAVGNAGHFAIYGISLEAENTDLSPTVSVDDSNITLTNPASGYDQQLNIAYQIGLGTRAGSHNLYVHTTAGTSNAGGFTVGDASPILTSVTPSTFTVGVATPVQIVGQHFGTNCPQLQFPFSATYAANSCTDSAVTITVTATAPGTGNLTLTAEGYAGQLFLAQVSGEPQSATKTVTATPPPPPTVTISGPNGIPLGGTASYTFTITPASNTQSVTIGVSKSAGTGAAQFSDGSTSKVITATTTLAIKGVTVSNAVDNIAIVANSQSGGQLAQLAASVVGVTITLRNSGYPSSDNNKGVDLQGYVGSKTLGPFVQPTSPNSCVVAVELAGQVQPSGYTGAVVLQRTITTNAAFSGVSGSSPAASPKVNGSPDTSTPALRDDTPSSSNGYAFDLDAPGISFNTTAPTYIWRFRVNLHQYATLGSDQSNTSIGTLDWYERSSCKESSDGFSGIFSNDVAGDNTAAAGTTPLSWNLK